MGKEASSKTNRPLKGVRILVGRARHQAGALSAELRKRGAQVLEIPFIEIRKPRSFRPLDSALKNLSTYDWLILTSVNGVEAMWDRWQKVSGGRTPASAWKISASAPCSDLKTRGTSTLAVAAIGPATKKAIEQRGIRVNVVPKEYIAESVVRSLKGKVKGKRVLLVRAKVARDVIPRELRKAGAHVDVVEAYETIVPESSRRSLQMALKNVKKRPDIVTFTSSSTVKNFVKLVGTSRNSKLLAGVKTASIGPVTSSTLRDLRLPVDIEARDFTIPGLVTAIVDVITSDV